MAEGHPGTVAAFAARYRREPDRVWAAPGRVVVVGDHTDYQSGLALASALPQTVTVAVADRDDEVVRWVSATTGEQGSASVQALADAGRRRPLPGLLGFLVGCLAVFQRDRGVDIWIEADLPPGAGLSSSAALALALGAALGERPEPDPAWAERVRAVENDYLGVPSGVLDQLTILHGSEGQAVHVDAATATGRPVDFDWGQAGLTLWVVDTREARRLSEVPYAQRVAEAASASAALGVPSLRGVTRQEVERLTDPLLRRRARHIVEENRRVLATEAAAQRGDWKAVAALLRESHVSLRDDFAVSTRRLNMTVERLNGLDDQVGARMTGGGFGGTAMALGARTLDGAVRTALRQLYREQGWPEPLILAVPRPAAGLRRIR
jgi:galactokinase